MKNSQLTEQAEGQEPPPSPFQQEEPQRLSPLSASPFKTSEQPQSAKKGKGGGKKEKKSKKEEKGTSVQLNFGNECCRYTWSNFVYHFAIDCRQKRTTEI